MAQEKVYLDEQGNPIKPAAPVAAAKVYLDEDGNPIDARPAASAPPIAPPARDPWKKPTNRAEFEQMLADMSAAESDRRTQNVQSLPMVGGMVGGLLGGPLGATIGGAGGEAWRQLDNRMSGKDAPGTPIQAAKDIGIEGAIQGAVEGAGRVVGSVANRFGHVLMENAIRPTQTLLKDFPDVVSTAIKERLPVGAGIFNRTRGSLRAAEQLGSAAKEVRRLIKAAEAGGKEFSPNDVLAPVLDLVDDIAKQPLSQGDMKMLTAMIDEFMDTHPGPLTPTAVKDLKQRAQAIAKPIFKAENAGFPVSADQSVKGRFNRAVSAGAKDSLETIPGVGPSEARTQRLIGATRALKSAEARRLGAPTEVVSGALGASALVGGLLNDNGNLPEGMKKAITAWLVVRGFGSPRSISRGGLILTDQQLRQLYQQFPRLGVEVLRSRGSAAGSSQ